MPHQHHTVLAIFITQSFTRSGGKPLNTTLEMERNLKRAIENIWIFSIFVFSSCVTQNELQGTWQLCDPELGYMEYHFGNDDYIVISFSALTHGVRYEYWIDNSSIYYKSGVDDTVTFSRTLLNEVSSKPLLNFKTKLGSKDYIEYDKGFVERCRNSNCCLTQVPPRTMEIDSVNQILDEF